MISYEAKDLITRMLQKEPLKRISAIDALNHRWFEISHSNSAHFDTRILSRLKEFRAPQRFQLEALTFLVNNLNKDIDFKVLRDAFRALDKNNTGILTIKEMKSVIKDS